MQLCRGAGAQEREDATPPSEENEGTFERRSTDDFRMTLPPEKTTMRKITTQE